jgi:hypothetical protein
LLRTVRRVLFPSNTFPRHPKTPPTAAETLALRRRAAEAVLACLPPAVANVYLGTGDGVEQRAQLELWLDLLGDPYCNKHLVFAVLELLVVRLVPELSERAVAELLAERIG